MVFLFVNIIQFICWRKYVPLLQEIFQLINVRNGSTCSCQICKWRLINYYKCRGFANRPETSEFKKLRSFGKFYISKFIVLWNKKTFYQIQTTNPLLSGFNELRCTPVPKWRFIIDIQFVNWTMNFWVLFRFSKICS